MNLMLTRIRITMMAALIGTAPVGVGQEDPAGIVAEAEAEPAVLHVERQDDRLILTAEHVHWEQIRAFGLIGDHRVEITSEVREALESQEVQVESRPDGFTLDLGPAENRNLEPGAGVLQLTLASGAVVSTPLALRADPAEAPTEPTPQLHGGFCQGVLHIDTPFERHTQRRQEALRRQAAAPAGFHLEFRRSAGHAVLAMDGATWDEVQTLTVQGVDGQDYTAALQDAIAHGSAWVTRTVEGFVLEIQDPELSALSAQEVVLTVDTGAVVAASIPVRRD